MPKVKWGLGDEEPEDLQEFEVYEGERPPIQVYRWQVRKLELLKNKNNDDMLKFFMVIDEPEGSNKAVYNGYPAWPKFNVTKESAPFIKRMLAAFGLKWSDFIERTVTEDEGRPTEVHRIGDVKFAMRPHVRTSTKLADEYNGERRLEPNMWLKPKDGEATSSAASKLREEAVFDPESDPDNPPF